LKGYKRVHVKAGDTEKVTIELQPKAFYSFNDNTQTFEVRPGKYQILYGGSSEDKALQSVALEIK
jgi:beta-glucosidase